MHTEPAWMPEIEARGGPYILTMRHPMAVARSWMRRGKPMDAVFCSMWENLFHLSQYESYWLPVDSADREQRLALIAKRFDVPCETSWHPVGESTGEVIWREGMTLDEAREFFLGLPFEQFGYEI